MLSSGKKREENVEGLPKAGLMKATEPAGVLTAKEQCCLQGLQILETLITRDLWIAARIVERNLVGICLEEVERAICVADFSKQKNALKVLFEVGAFLLDSNGNTLLHRAMVLNSVDCVKMVLEVNRDLVASRTRLGETPLHVAANEGLAECVEVLLQAVSKHVNDDLHFPGNPRNLEYETAMEILGISMSRHNYRSLEDHSGPDVQDYIGHTPLYLAALSGSEECVRLLLAAGADVNARKVQKWLRVPFETQCWRPISRFLDYDEGRTQLHLAASKGHADVARTFISAGASVEVIDKRGRTPLHLAAFEGHTEVVKILLAAGVNAKAKDCDGITPHDCAKTREIADMLATSRKRFPWCCKTHT